MDWQDESHRASIKLDLLVYLNGGNKYDRTPTQIPIEDILDTFSNRPDQKLRDLIEEMVNEDPAIEYATRHEDTVWLTTENAIDEYRDELKGKSAWFK